MRKIYFHLAVAMLVCSLGTFAQPTVFYTNLTSASNPALTNSRLSLNDLGAFRQCRFQTTAAPAPSPLTYAFHTGSTGSPDYSNNWRPYTPADATGISYPLNTVAVPGTVVNSARFNSSSGGTDGNLAALANNTYYTVNIQENAAADNLSAIWSTSFNPVTFSGITQLPVAGSVNPGNAVVVSITSSASLGSGENVYLRYSTNGFTTSVVVQAAFTGTTGTVTIPGLTAGANVSYYIFSSNRSLAQLTTIVGTAGIGQAGYDMATLNLENNGGANYSYTVAAGINPVTVNASGGTATADYGDLKQAFDAINAGTHTGAITILINGNTNELATAVLNASGTGSANYTGITINPAGGGARTISGAITAGNPLIDLNGADNVMIDGLNSGGNSLTISNTTVSSTSGTSTIRFQTDATNNTITNCSVLGSSTSAVGTNGGNIWFGSAAVTVGNDNNTISNCNIGPAGANLPSKGIYFSGSSNTDPGTANSGIVITGNNIFDYFSATASSSGIDINSGTVGTIISNNKFYQTGTRTMTSTSLTHSAIRISNTSGNAYQITGNTIGFASSAGTGMYTLVATATSPIIMINLSVNTVTATSVQGNTIAGIAISGTSSGTSSSGAFRGIYVGSGLSTVGDVTGNTIGSQSATGSITYTSSSTSASDVIGIFNFGSSNWVTNNNTVGGITGANSSTGATNVYGLRCNTGSTVTWIATDNIIGGTVANSLQSTSTAGGTTVEGILNSNPAATFLRNTVRNLTAAGGTGTTTSASVIGIVSNATSANHTISQSIIYNLTNTNTTAATVVTGIQYNASTGTNIVQRNLIYDLGNASNSTGAEVNGIRVSGGTTTYRNNVIRLGAGIANAIGTGSTTGGVNGINEPLGTDNFYHNSVYIDGAPTAGVGPSYAFNSSQTVNVRAFRNNIFVNARSNSGATGKNYIVRVGGTAANPTGLTINNNVYYANGTGAVFGLFNAADVANLAAWQTAVGQDAASLNADPLYVSATDLHIQAGSPAIDVAANVGVTNDFEGDGRPGANALYDIGADERDGTPATLNDIQATAFINPTSGGSKLAGTPFAPQASFTNLGVNNQTNITVKYRILDASLVEVYAQTAVIPALTSAAGTTITFPNATVVAGGTYTIQAIALLVGDQVVTNDTLTGTLIVKTPLAGTYTVGTGGNYPSLTNTGGIFDDLNTLGATANININIISDLTGETGTVALNELPGGYAVSMQPTGAPRTVTGSVNNGLIRINGADKVTINGSTTGASASGCIVGGSAAIRELTFQNTNTGTSAGVIAVQSGSNGAKNIVIKNLNILGQDPTTTLAGIALGGNTIGTVGTDNDSNRVENCSIKRAIYGIYSAGASTTNMNIYTVMTQNELDSTSATDRIRRIGIALFNDSGSVITYNRITGINTTESNDAVGIAIGIQGIDNTITTSGGIQGALIANNKVNGVASLSTTGFSAAGIAIAGGAGTANVIRNNMVTGVTAPATSPDLVAGIYVAGVTGSDTRLYYNSVSMTGDRGTVATQMPSFGLAITGTDPTVDVRNNIFYTSQTASGGGANALSFGIGTVGTAFANLTTNYNAFWTTGANDGGYRSGSLAAGAGTNYATLAAWQAAVTDDANSVDVDPGFISPVNDLHINPAVCTFKGLGTPIAGISDDYDCNGRNATTPDIGADEFNPAATAATIVAGQVAATATTNQAVRYIVNGTTDYLYTCNRIIATLTPAGGSPVSGNVNVGVRVDTGATKMGTARLFAARFFDVMPINNAATATGTVKLYMLQSEFDNYNLKAADSGYLPLPDNGANTVDSLRILIYHGAPSGGYFPGNYSGGVEELSVANPGVSVVWNPAGNNGTGWWEITFPTTGFSGYFISSKPVNPVPIKIEYFRGAKQGGNHVLDWKVVPVNTANGVITLERSSDGRSFSSLYSITASATRMLLPFNYSTNNLLKGTNYYRLKMVDDNGVVTYSAIVALLNSSKGFELVNITPNPVTEGRFKLNISAAEQLKMEVVVTDMAGRVVSKQTNTLISGFNAVEVNVNQLANGMYQVMGIIDGERTKAFKFVKQ